MASGIQDIPLRRIPKEWDPQWFAEFVRDVLQYADVRNMRVAPQMVLTGQSDDYASLEMAENQTELAQIEKQLPLTVIANPTNALANLQAVAAGIDGQIFGRDGATLAFLTKSPVITLGNDLSGNATLTNLQSATLSATIANDAVTNAKLANMAQALIKGRASGAGTGDPSDLTAAEVATIVTSSINHDGTLNFVANKHIDHTAVTLTAGNGLTGGGDISASRTFDVGAGTGITVNANDVALANMAQATIKGRASGAGTGVPTDLSATDVATIVATAVATALNITAISSYTPTLTNVTNLDSSAANTTYYIRVRDFVLVFGNLAANATAAAATQLDISLPVASAIQSSIDLGGVGFCGAVAGFGAAIVGESVNDRASMTWVATDTNNRTIAFIFGYRII